jgi:hypothetical protein
MVNELLPQKYLFLEHWQGHEEWSFVRSLDPEAWTELPADIGSTLVQLIYVANVHDQIHYALSSL